jgi:hypothetical protein
LYYLVRNDFDLPAGQARAVTQEIESHTGLIVEVGYGRFAFAHKAFQEFFCAHYISRLGRVPREPVLRIPDEMALTVAMSSDASHVFADVVKAVRREKVPQKNQFFPRFLRRLALEGPDYRLEALLGAAYLEIAALLSAPVLNGADLNPDVAWDSMKAIAEHPNGHASIRRFLTSNRISILPERKTVQVFWQIDRRAGRQSGGAEQDDFFRGLPNPLMVHTGLLPNLLDEKLLGTATA